MTEKEFNVLVRKANKPREMRFRNSYDMRDYYRYFQKKYGRHVLTEVEFGDIIRAVNASYVEDLNEDRFVVLPKRMGRMQVTYKRTKAVEIDGEIKVFHKKDWNSTLALWHSDPEAYKNKTVVYFDHHRTRRPCYYKHRRNFKNQIFFKFLFARPVAKLITLKEITPKIKPLHYG